MDPQAGIESQQFEFHTIKNAESLNKLKVLNIYIKKIVLL